MSAEKILLDFKKKNFKPIYWLEGEEPFFIDEIVEYAETKILSESETSFNLTVVYGKDTDWTEVINACRRYPMFSEKQVVIIKEAQQMKNIEKLENYFDNPLVSTILIICYKDKKLDARTNFAKKVKSKSEFLSTKKIYDNQMPEWVNSIAFGLEISVEPKAVLMLIQNIGSDLSRIKTELEKIKINLGARKTITADDIENFVGVSKEYNIFELQEAIAKKQMGKALNIIQYFDKNPKAAPIQLILPSLYSFFSKVYAIYAVPSNDEKQIAATLGLNAYFAKSYIDASRLYNSQSVEKILLLLHHYNLKSVGINNTNTSDASLMKEFIVKAIA